MNLQTYKIRDARTQLGLTIENVSEITGASEPTLSNLENGKIKRPSLYLVANLAKLYRVSIKEWLDDE